MNWNLFKKMNWNLFKKWIEIEVNCMNWYGTSQRHYWHMKTDVEWIFFKSKKIGFYRNWSYFFIKTIIWKNLNENSHTIITKFCVFSDKFDRFDRNYDGKYDQISSDTNIFTEKYHWK